MAAVEAAPLAPEATAARLQEAREALERQAARLTNTGDPMGEMIGCCAVMAGCLHRLAVDLSLKTAAHTKALAAAIEDVRLPVDGIERAVRSSLLGLQPAFERRWRWQRWTELAVAFAVGCAITALVGLATWNLAATVTEHRTTAELQTWWASSCGDQSPHRVVIAGKAFCQVPMATK